MHYTLMFHLSPEEFASRSDPARQEAYWGSFMPYFKAVQESGIFVSGAGLEGPTVATTLRQTGQGYQVQDGPFADTKEQLGGFFVIDVPDLDTALQWASRYPAGPGGGVEVRPNLPQAAREKLQQSIR